MKSLLLRTIFNLMKKYNDDKIKLAKLKEYEKIFNKKTINMKDVREFYKEFK